MILKSFAILFLFFTNLFAVEVCSGENAKSIPECMKRCESDIDCSLVTRECYNFSVNIKYVAEAKKIIDDLKLSTCTDTLSESCKFARCISNQCIFLQQNCMVNGKKQNELLLTTSIKSEAILKNIISSNTSNMTSTNSFSPRELRYGLNIIINLLNSDNNTSKEKIIFKEKLKLNRDYLLQLVNSKYRDEEIVADVIQKKRDSYYLQAAIAFMIIKHYNINIYKDEELKRILITTLEELNFSELVSLLEVQSNFFHLMSMYNDISYLNLNIDEIKFKNIDNKIIGTIVLRNFLSKQSPAVVFGNENNKSTQEPVFFFNEILKSSNPIVKKLINNSTLEQNSFQVLGYLVEKDLVNLLEVWKNSRDLFGLKFERKRMTLPSSNDVYIEKYVLNHLYEFIQTSKSEKEACNLVKFINDNMVKYLNDNVKDNIKKLMPFKYECLNLLSKTLENKKEYVALDCKIELYKKDLTSKSDVFVVPDENCSRLCEKDSDCSNLVPQSCYAIPMNKIYIEKYTSQKDLIKDSLICKSFKENESFYQCSKNICITNDKLFWTSMSKTILENELTEIQKRPEILSCEFDSECRSVSISNGRFNNRFTIGSSNTADDYYYKLISRYEKLDFRVYFNPYVYKDDKVSCVQNKCKASFTQLNSF